MHFLKKNFISRNLFTGHARSVLAKKNIVASVLVKGISIVIGFAMVPLTIDYLDPTRYGIWLTLSSIINFFNFFDVGLGNGLRNKLAEAFARNDSLLAKKYISTTYAILAIIMVLAIGIFLGINPFLDWHQILNTSQHLKTELHHLVLIVFILFGLKLVLKLIGVVLVADQRPAINNCFAPISNIIALILILILLKTTEGKLLWLGLVVSVTPVTVLLIATICCFRTRYKKFTPSVKDIDFKYFNELTELGVQFFLIQISTMVIFSTDNLIITQILGPEAVTPYNIAHKYFYCVVMIFSIITTPFWSAYTHAYVKNDIPWIRQIIQKLIRIWWILAIAVGVMLAHAAVFYRIWVGNEIEIPFMLSALMGLYVIIFSWNRIFNVFINGTGKIRLQLYNSILIAILNIPLSILFAKNFHMGSAGVILATSACLLIGSVLAPIQYYKLINQTARGIWDK